jgi:hypothetical protein
MNRFFFDMDMNDNLDINHGVAPRGKGTEVGTILQLQTCPYNESHRVGHGSFPAHLHNCRKVCFY